MHVFRCKHAVRRSQRDPKGAATLPNPGPKNGQAAARARCISWLEGWQRLQMQCRELFVTAGCHTAARPVDGPVRATPTLRPASYAVPDLCRSRHSTHDCSWRPSTKASGSPAFAPTPFLYLRSWRWKTMRRCECVRRTSSPTPGLWRSKRRMRTKRLPYWKAART
jgi:hypothetical protein